MSDTPRIAYESLGSTNTQAFDKARSGVEGPLWITAEKQTAGRGRRGRQWVSEPGNLYASLLLSDPSPPQRTAELPLLAALALRDAVIDLNPELAPDLAVKWPNDLLLRGRKAAGILVEGERVGDKPVVVIGIGVNCRHAPETSGYGAISLSDVVPHAPTPDDLFQVLSRTMQRRLAQWNRGEGFAAIRNEWLTHVAGLGTDIRVRVPSGELTGRFEALDEAGRLVLRLSDGRRELVTAGDVFLVAGDLPARAEARNG